MKSIKVFALCGMAAVLGACVAPTPAPSPAPTQAPATAVPTKPPAPTAVVPTAAPASTSSAPTPLPYDKGVLTILTHSSFEMTADLKAAFEKQTGAKVQILKLGDAGEALNKVILSKGSPLGDVFYGVDNTFLSRAVKADIFDAYTPKGADALPSTIKLDASGKLTPIDVGYVNINTDLAAFAKSKLAVPKTLKDLTKLEYKGMLVMENPATSSPGLAFMLASIATFGETGAYTWKDFWKDMRANGVVIQPGWNEAYYQSFSAGSGSQGNVPMVVSYATSPAAEVFFSEGKLTEPPTGNIMPDNGAFKQVEFAGVLKGAKNPELARQWLDFMISKDFQEDIPLNMFVYPALPSAKLPDVFTKFAPVPAKPAALTPEQISANRDRWIQEWTQVVLR
ncbi:MAG TPA: thiamine ABC transporter substrate-binding protein [Thermoflexales bacterium]|nr:thiamine ABC transporter substrate-binding protein [Thermoflexales bacterium]